jgi:hypothetical protein
MSKILISIVVLWDCGREIWLILKEGQILRVTGNIQFKGMYVLNEEEVIWG